MRIDRLRQPTRWEDWRFTIAEVVLDDGLFGVEQRVLRDDGHCTQWLFPNLPVSLHRDEAEGYYLNVVTSDPRVFVLWRMEGEQGLPVEVTVSFNEAGRWLDGGHSVDGVAMPAEIYAWVGDYVEKNYRPEPKKRIKPRSFQHPKDRV